MPFDVSKSQFCELRYVSLNSLTVLIDAQQQHRYHERVSSGSKRIIKSDTPEEKMHIRYAEEKDCEKIMDLLSQVREVHAAIRPDIFIPGMTKYSKEELPDIMKDDNRPVYVAADETDQVTGYAFCILTNQPKSEDMVQFTSL